MQKQMKIHLIIHKIYILFVHTYLLSFLNLYYNPECSHNQSICSRQQLFPIILNDYNSSNSRPLFYSHSHIIY